MNRYLLVCYVKFLWYLCTVGESATFHDEIKNVQRVITGSAVQLKCSLQSQGNDDGVFWMHDGVIFAVGRTSYKRRIRVQTDDVTTYDVIINSATEADQGLYQCQALPSGFQVITYLWVDVPPRISLFYPGAPSVDIHLGDTLQLDCRATGRPPPNVTWTHMGAAVSRSSQYVLREVTVGEAGVYQCTADNGVDRPAQRHVNVSVLYPPVVYVGRKELHVGLHRTLTIECHVDAKPPARLSWKHNDSDVIERVDVIVNSRKTTAGDDVIVLRVDRCDVRDVGEYTCEAENRFGRATDNVRVTGVPDRLKITSDSRGQYSDQFELRWTVRSTSSLDETLLRLKSVPPSASVDELRKLTLNYSAPDRKLMTRWTRYVISELSASSVYSVAIRTRNVFGYSDWTHEYYFETAPDGHEAPPSHVRASRLSPPNSRASVLSGRCVHLFVSAVVYCFLRLTPGGLTQY